MENVSPEKLSVCLAYPNRREIGVSNLGFHKIYSAFTEAGADCKAGFMDELPFDALRRGQPELLAFSVTFEMDEPNVLRIIAEAGMPLKRTERGDDAPLVCAGGVAVTLNPEPLSDFIDFFVIGEGENVAARIVEVMAESRGERKLERLKKLASIEGVYVPALYDVTYDENSRIKSRKPLHGAPEKVLRLYDPEYGREGTAQLPELVGSIFGDAFLMETGKGCGQGCRFCAAGFIYRPVRHVDTARLKEQADEGLREHKRIGLVGSAICEHPEMDELYEHILAAGGEMTVSSLRIGLTSSETFHQLAGGGLKTVTIAPEAGSDRLRKIINKNMSEEEIIRTVKDAVTAGIPNLKCYFLIGLPGETDEDIEALVGLVSRMREAFMEASRPTGHAGKITISANPFVPKPFTPFQWEAMAPLSELKKKTAFLRKKFGKMPNVEFKAESLRLASAQALLSVGSRLTGSILPDILNGKSWNEALKTAAAYHLRKKSEDEILPWDFIATGVRREYLWKEYLKSTNEKPTPPCPPEGSGCRRCGEFEGVCI